MLIASSIIIIIIIIMKANSAGKRVVIGGGHARKEGRWKSGNERGYTIPCGGNDIDVNNVDTGRVFSNGKLFSYSREFHKQNIHS